MRTATVSRPAVARSATAQLSAFGNTSVSGPGQNAAANCSRCRIKARDLSRGSEIADMRDQRVEGRAALGLVEVGDRSRIGGVGPEAIDGFSGERDQLALGQGARGGCRRGRAGRQNPRFQA